MAKNKMFSPMRVAFVGLDKPTAYKDKDGKEGKSKFSITVLIPKKDKGTYKEVYDFLVEAINSNGSWKSEKKKQILAKCTKTVTDEGVNNLCVIRDGDELNKQRLIDDKTPYEFFKGAWVVKFSRPASFSPAMVVDQRAKEIPPALIPTTIRPGFWVIVEASAYVFDGANSGVSLQLQGVQLVKEDEEFGRQNNFTAVEGSDDDEDTESKFDDNGIDD